MDPYGQFTGGGFDSSWADEVLRQPLVSAAQSLLRSGSHGTPLRLIATTGAETAEVFHVAWYVASALLLICTAVVVLNSKKLMSTSNEDQTMFSLAPLVVTWVTISGGLTWVNKMIFAPVEQGGFGFPYVTFLMLWHMFLVILFTNIIRFAAPQLMPAAAKNEVTLEKYFKNIFPVGVFLAGSLTLSNAAYIYISVGYIQMVKSCTSSVVYLVAVLVGQETFEWSVGASICLVCAGVVAASFGELDFSLIGFALQVTATIIEALRLCVLKALVSSQGISLDALSGLYYYAPTCFVAILLPFSFGMDGAFPWDRVWELRSVLLANGLIAFFLHLTILVFLRRASSTTYAATGILKDIILIASTSVYYRHPVTLIQCVGYGGSLLGLNLFNRMKEQAAATRKTQQQGEEALALLQKEPKKETA